MPILKTGKIQSHGPDVGLTARITALEDKYVKALWYAEIGSGTSGTITPPANGTIVLNEWGADVDAVTSTITTTKKPDFVSAKTAAGAIVTATLAANGAWTISGAPSAYPIALVYVYEIKLINFDRAYSLYEEEISQGVQPTDSPTFAGLTLSGLTASLPIITDAAKALASLAYTGATSLRKNLGLEPTDAPTFDDLSLYDTSASHILTLHWNENEATANRILNLVMGGADRTITLSGNPTLADWFDQEVKAASGPTFNHLHTASIIAPANYLGIKPTADDTGGIQIMDKDGNVILNIDTTNNALSMGTVVATNALFTMATPAGVAFVPLLFFQESTTNYGFKFLQDDATSGDMRIDRVIDGTGYAVLQFARATGIITVASLAGVGTRNVVASATGVLSAP